MSVLAKVTVPLGVKFKKKAFLVILFSRANW